MDVNVVARLIRDGGRVSLMRRVRGSSTRNGEEASNVDLSVEWPVPRLAELYQSLWLFERESCAANSRHRIQKVGKGGESKKGLLAQRL